MALSLAIRDVEAGYGAVRALHGVSVTVESGKTVALLGTNGNGKSTLMKCVMGMVRPTRGSIELVLDNEKFDLTRLSTEEIVNLGVAMVPEGRRLFPKLTVEENLMLGAFRPKARSEISRNLNFSYELFPILTQRRRQLAGSLSGGQQQMLAIARALIALAGPYDLSECWGALNPLTKGGYIFYTKSRNEAEAFEKAKTLTLRGVLDRVTCPLLVIHGAQDRLFPLEQAERIVREAPKATLLLYPDGNHVCNNIAYKYRPAMADWMGEQLA